MKTVRTYVGAVGQHWIIALYLLAALVFMVPNSRADVPLISLDSIPRGVSLSGEWQFQPGDDMAWLSPQYDDSRWGTLSVPGRWPGEGHPETKQFAWYRLTLQLDLIDPQQRTHLPSLGIRMGKVMSAYELYAGGMLLGGVGKLPPLSEVNYDRTRVFQIPPGAVAENGQLVLALRVWGGDDLGVKNFGGGAYAGDVVLGEYAYLLKSGVVSQMPGLLMAVLFVGFGIYHLYLNRRNRQLQSYLWFGLVAINVGIYALMLNQWKYLLDWSFVTYEKIEYCAIYLFPLLAIQLLWTTLGQPISRLMRVYQSGFALSAVGIVAVSGMEIHYATLHYWQFYTLPLVVYAPWLVMREARAGNPEARTALVGVIIFIATCINDLSLDLAGVETSRLLPYGFVAIMLSMAVSLANRFTAVLNTLEHEVAERTADLQAANVQLADAARHDPLTGVFNRRGFIEAAEVEAKRVARSGKEFSVVLADIDNFKLFNDRYGHACGDHVLYRVADMLKMRMRDVDRMGRWGGEEFIFLLPETDAEGAGVLAEKLRDAIANNLFEYSGERVTVTLTFGVAVHRKGESLDSAIARADNALYRGKERGRNQVMVGGYKNLSLVN
ncbi:MAG: diguanylate cyclase [Halioglobus sp.]